ncbi:PEX13 [Mytilus coruscus]|uniref:Peroxisomal membrane protein PEX13 n=1 Tax=Mytilus coruscus TaxID=42192 RepID=A0A6J8E338_MYTCO|nr:PEX13 [Mytilus coruscus]
MAAPPKPWEITGVNQQNAGNIPVNNMSGLPLNSGAGGGLPPCCQPSAAAGSGPPPPVPTRPSQQSNYSRFSSPYGYSSPYSSMGMYGGGMYGGGYGGMSSPYSGGGMYGGGYGGQYGSYGNGEYNGFARQAEENSRQAFQSVESIVNAFTSVSMMLDSTFQAVYNSFRAVIGVADNFSRLKHQLSSVFSAFALFKFVRYLYRKVLVLLRLRPNMETDEAWSQAAASAIPSVAGDGDSPKKSTWPIMMFLAIIMGGPYLIWRLISSVTQTPGKQWMTGEDDHFVATAQYDYKAENEGELSFSVGQEIKVAPKEIQPRIKGWLLASVDGQKIGIIPGNYVKVLGKRQGTRKVNQVAIEAAQNTVTESCCSKENTTPKSCCDKSQNSSLNCVNDNLENVSTENPPIDSSNNQVLDNAFGNMDNTSEMEAYDIVDKCQD